MIDARRRLDQYFWVQIGCRQAPRGTLGVPRDESDIGSPEYHRCVRTLILAGGFGSRLSEETVSRPKPMVEIGNDPILWHILKHYAHHGYDDFVIALGYRGEMIKQYFAQYAALAGDLTVRTSAGLSSGTGRASRTGRSTSSIPASTRPRADGCAGSPICWTTRS